MKQKVKNYIQEWQQKCYFDGIPDEAPLRLEQLNKVPSYRKICFAILRNDYSLKTLGLTQNKIPVYHEFKKIELAQRNKYQYQLKLNI